MLKIWIGKYERYHRLGKPDSHISRDFNPEPLESDFARRLIHDCSDGSEVINPVLFKHQIRGHYYLEQLPSGVQTLLIARYDNSVVCDIKYLSKNCFPYLVEASNEVDMVVSLSKYLDFIGEALDNGDFVGGIYAMNTDEIINTSEDWHKYWEEHGNDVIENEPDAVDPFDWIEEFEDI